MRKFMCLLAGSAAVVGFESMFGISSKADRCSDLVEQWKAAHRGAWNRVIILDGPVSFKPIGPGGIITVDRLVH